MFKMKISSMSLLSLLLFLALGCSQKPVIQAGGNEVSLPPACQDSICRLQINDYPQEVAVLIPPYANYKKIALFLHDFSQDKKRYKNLDGVMKDLEIAKSFRESGTDRILIVPFSSGKNTDFRKNFKNKLELQVFFANLYKVFGIKLLVEDLHFIGHGESYKTIQEIIRDQSPENQNLNISQITLLDGTYSGFKPKIFNQWIKSANGNKMTVIYLKGSAAEAKALQFWSLFSGEKPGKEGGINLGDAEYLTLIPESEFKKSTSAHWLLAKKWFGRIL
jgi:hypothetical protein